ncbi:MAG: amidohydrolase [Alphaproteobacteria bacterium]|nr:amidohydrolase [Alphaproteobacteria bacterium]
MPVIDCHAHYDPAMLDAEAMLARMDAAGVERVALIPAMNEPLPHTPELLLAVMRKVMNSPARPLAELIHRSTMTRDGNLKLSGEVIQIFKQPDIASVAELVSQHPARLMGWIFLNPGHDPDPVGTLERWRASPGMIGVKLHPHWHDYRTEILGPVLQRCEELGLPVLIHLGFGRRGDFVSMCQAYPKLKLISAHAGFPFYKALWRYRSDCPNLFVDLSSPYLDEALAREAVRHMGPERCLYGTDAPYGFPAEDGGYDYGEIRRWVERMPASSGQIEGMLGDGFLELLDGARP